MSSKNELVGIAESPTTHPVDVIAHVVDTCTKACTCCLENDKSNQKNASWLSLKKTLAMYLTMVCVSTLAIYLLEHASILSAMRTAVVAAIGKTIAANWVVSLFQ